MNRRFGLRQYLRVRLKSRSNLANGGVGGRSFGLGCVAWQGSSTHGPMPCFV